MKHILSIFLLLISTSCFSQPSGRENRFTDSLTFNNHRTWFREDGVRFTKVNDNCSYGIEITFYKENSKVIMRKCDRGAWKEFEYKFRITTKDENHYVEIVDDKKAVITTLEIQMLGSGNNFKTEVTYYNINAKEFYTLISNE